MKSILNFRILLFLMNLLELLLMFHLCLLCQLRLGLLYQIQFLCLISWLMNNWHLCLLHLLHLFQKLQ
jgi:uncharacterized Tic20 family protein